MLGHPAILLGDGGGDAQGETLLAEEGVAAVSGTVGLDLLGLGEVHDVFLVVARPGAVLLALLEGGARRRVAPHTTRPLRNGGGSVVVRSSRRSVRAARPLPQTLEGQRSPEIRGLSNLRESRGSAA